MCLTGIAGFNLLEFTRCSKWMGLIFTKGSSVDVGGVCSRSYEQLHEYRFCAFSVLCSRMHAINGVCIDHK